MARSCCWPRAFRVVVYNELARAGFLLLDRGGSVSDLGRWMSQLELRRDRAHFRTVPVSDESSTGYFPFPARPRWSRAPAAASAWPSRSSWPQAGARTILAARSLDKLREHAQALADEGFEASALRMDHGRPGTPSASAIETSRRRTSWSTSPAPISASASRNTRRQSTSTSCRPTCTASWS